MANRLDYYFRQKLTEAELDEGFDKLEQGDLDIMADQLLVGVWTGAVVSQHSPTADLTIDISGPAIGRDKDGARLFFNALQNLDMSIDENGVTTAVGTPGNEKTLAVFWAFDRSLSDPRVDGNSNTVFFKRNESFKLNVVQSAEALVSASVPPALRVDEVLLADVVLINAQTQILNADISTARREDVFDLTGSPFNIKTGRVHDALQFMLDNLNTISNGGAVSIGYAGGPNWADATTNPAVSVEAQLDKIITDIGGGTDGTAKVSGAASINANPLLTATTLASQLTELESEIVDGSNKHGLISSLLPLPWGYGEGGWTLESAGGFPTWLLTGAPVSGDFVFLPLPMQIGDVLDTVLFSYESDNATHDFSYSVIKIDQHPTGTPIVESALSGPTNVGGIATTFVESATALAHTVNSVVDQYYVKIEGADVGVGNRRIRNYGMIKSRESA